MPRRRKLKSDQVSERGLEFNVLSEAINTVRRVYGKAYLVGFTTRQEAYHGLDVSIDAPGNMLAAFQFKAPKRSGGRYVFTIGGKCWVCSNPSIGGRRRESVAEVLRELGISRDCMNQHILLYVTSIALKLIGLDVYYALPLVSTYSELEQYVPNLMKRTVLIPVLNLPATLLDCKTHKILVEVPSGDARNAVVYVHSEPIKLPKESYMLFDEMLEKKLKEEKNLPEARQTIHIPVDELRTMLKQAFTQVEGGERLAEALTQISFTYRGTMLTVKRVEEEQNQ